MKRAAALIFVLAAACVGVQNEPIACEIQWDAGVWEKVSPGDPNYSACVEAAKIVSGPPF